MIVADRMERSARRSAWLLIVAPLAVLAGWLFDVPRLIHPFGPIEAATATMKPLTAVAFVLSGVALRFWTAPIADAHAARRRRLARVVGALVAGVGAVELLGRAWGFESGIDGLVAAGAGPMSAQSALLFVVSGAGLAFFEERAARVRGRPRFAELCGIVAQCGVIVAALDLLLGLVADRAPPAPAYRGVAVTTALCFFVLSTALLTARPRTGWMSVLSADTHAAREAYRLLAVLAPLVAGISVARFLAEERGLVSGRYGVALMAGAMTLVLVVVAWRALVTLRDATDEVQRQKNVVDAILENIPHMIFVKDAAALRFLRFNRAGERLLGMSREQLLGKNDYEFFPKEQADFFVAKDRATLAGGAAVDIPEEPIDTAHGKRWLHTIKVPVKDVDAPAFLLGISEDITERKRVADELVRAKEAAEATSRELEAFSYAVSHDLRAPLRSIDGFSQALLEDCADQLDEAGRAHLQRVRAAAQRMATLIDALLDLSRVSRQELKREDVDLSALAGAAVGDLRRAEPERAVDVVVADGMRAAGDKRLIAVVLENLIGNAWKFTAKKSNARVEIGSVRDAATQEERFFVKDNGAGFDMQYANKLFGAFQRLHGYGEFAGTGIGLATVQRIVQRHGGRVWADAAVDAGATFTFTLAPPATQGTRA